MKSTPAFIFILFSGLSLASTKGEVKILYPCESLNLIPHEKETKGTVTFLETKEGTLYQNGLILRKRKDSKESDITIKKRWDDKPVLDATIQTRLSESVNGELKCESDISYDEIKPKSVESCSFKSEGHELFREHTDFIKMVKSPISEIPAKLREITLNSVNWKIPVGGFKKKPELELWKKANGECVLEASAKFENNDSRAVLTALKASIKAVPSPLQISKTGWALGLSKRASK
jgi:hypothetical protein